MRTGSRGKATLALPEVLAGADFIMLDIQVSILASLNLPSTFKLVIPSSTNVAQVAELKPKAWIPALNSAAVSGKAE